MNSRVQRAKQLLQEITNKQPHSIAVAVAEEALSYHDVTNFFSDLLSYGCQSGMIGSLIYYSDTHRFYDNHYSEIEELRYEYEECMGEALAPSGDLKNWFAWFAFEETARKMATDLDIWC